jgi:hypothetical protein
VTITSGAFDYVFNDWKIAGLRYPSALKPVLFTLDPTRLLYQIGALSTQDLAAVDQRLRLMLGV